MTRLACKGCRYHRTFSPYLNLYALARIEELEKQVDAYREKLKCMEGGEQPVIFDEIAEVMNSQADRKLSRRMGLSRTKISRLANGLPFTLDYNTVFAFQRLGYEIRLVKREKNRRSAGHSES